MTSRGFSAIFTIIGVVFIFLLLFVLQDIFLAPKDKQFFLPGLERLLSNDERFGESKQDAKPKLQNIGINIDKYDQATKKAGDFVFEDTIDHYQHKILLEFAIELGGPGGKSSLPSLNYVLPLDALVFSPVHGVVDLVRFQEQDNDYEIGIIPDDASLWRLYFDHVVNIKVQKGDKLKPGDPIGNATPQRSLGGKKGFVELQVEKSSRSGPPQASCPILLLDDSVRAGIEAKITQFAKDWEQFLGRDVYDESKWVAPGCLAEKDES